MITEFFWNAGTQSIYNTSENIVWTNPNYAFDGDQASQATSYGYGGYVGDTATYDYITYWLYSTAAPVYYTGDQFRNPNQILQISKVEFIYKTSYDTTNSTGWSGNGVYYHQAYYNGGWYNLYNDVIYQGYARSSVLTYMDITTFTGAPAVWTWGHISAMQMRLLGVDANYIDPSDPKYVLISQTNFQAAHFGIRITWTKKPNGLIFGHNF